MSRKALFIPELIPSLLTMARGAGDVIMRHYKHGPVVDSKDDASPVTEADRAADRLIVAGLKILTPAVAIVSEEGDKPQVTAADYFWLVDPLDGTRSFVRGSGYFTVNIALIDRAGNVPVLGVIYDPVHDVMYWGSKEGAFREDTGNQARQIHVRMPQPGKMAALISHTHINRATEDYLAAQGVSERIPCASSIKFCWLAEGKADLYPRFGPTMEWDTAAGHAVLLGAGGQMTTPDGAPFLYGKEGFLNGSFVAGSGHL